MDDGPCVAVAHAEPVQCLSAGPEANAGGVRVGVEVASNDDVPRAVGEQVVDGASGGDGLQLTFVLEVQLPARKVVDQPDPPD